MRTGIATVPLDWGKCPPWLFKRMKKLSRGIALAIIEEFGEEELLKRLSDPVWFQSFGCVIGFDWNSSGLTTTTLGALKEGLRGLEDEMGIFICGGKGKTSRKTPRQIQEWGEFLKFPLDKIDGLIYASRTSAKVDSSLIQDGFQIYHHNLIFSRKGSWAVIQQGLDIENQKARRYHWLSSNVKNFVEEPHSGIISQTKKNPLNLTAKESKKNKEISRELVVEEPKQIIKDLKMIIKRSPQRKKESFTQMSLENNEFNWHPVVDEKFDFKRLEKNISIASNANPKNFEMLLTAKGIGPKTIRALSLVAELIYGAKPSYEDPARYTFAYGGKDGTPYPVDRKVYDKSLEIIERGINKSKISNNEKTEAKKRLLNKIR
jgi:uncharacterized protein